MNKESLTKYISESDTETCIKFISSLTKSLSQKYKAREKTSNITLDTTKAYNWIRWGARSKQEANHTRNCEIYDEIRKQLTFVISEFNRLK